MTKSTKSFKQLTKAKGFKNLSSDKRKEILAKQRLIKRRLVTALDLEGKNDRRTIEQLTRLTKFQNLKADQRNKIESDSKKLKAHIEKVLESKSSKSVSWGEEEIFEEKPKKAKRVARKSKNTKKSDEDVEDEDEQTGEDLFVKEMKRKPSKGRKPKKKATKSKKPKKDTSSSDEDSEDDEEDVIDVKRNNGAKSLLRDIRRTLGEKFQILTLDKIEKHIDDDKVHIKVLFGKKVFKPEELSFEDVKDAKIKKIMKGNTVKIRISDSESGKETILDAYPCNGDDGTSQFGIGSDCDPIFYYVKTKSNKRNKA